MKTTKSSEKASEVWTLYDLNPGDIVVANRGTSRIVGIGKVTRATFQVGYLLTVDKQVRATAVTVHGCVTHDGRAARMPDWLAGVAELGTTL